MRDVPHEHANIEKIQEQRGKYNQRRVSQSNKLPQKEPENLSWKPWQRLSSKKWPIMNAVTKALAQQNDQDCRKFMAAVKSKDGREILYRDQWQLLSTPKKSFAP